MESSSASRERKSPQFASTAVQSSHSPEPRNGFFPGSMYMMPHNLMMGTPFNVCNFNCSVPMLPPFQLPPHMVPPEFARLLSSGMHGPAPLSQMPPPHPLITKVAKPFGSREETGGETEKITLISSGSHEQIKPGRQNFVSPSTNDPQVHANFPGQSGQTRRNSRKFQQSVQPVIAAARTTPIPNGINNPGVPYPILGYLDTLSISIWQYFTETRQSPTKYAKKVNFRNAMHMMMSSVFENSRLFIVGSSINGFGSDQSDMDLCLTVTSQDLQAKRETSLILSQLMTPLRKCNFIRNCTLIRAKVPILKFRDDLAGVDCDLNVNNVVGIYNTHLLAMYTRVDWRVRPLGMFVKYWAEKMDIHDGSRGRLSTYPLLLMLIQFLQCGCSPPVLPNLQARFPKLFNYELPVNDLDMRLELPWAELCSSNSATLSELFVGFINHYNTFDFNNWAISIKHGSPLPIDVAIRCLPPHEQAHTSCSFKIFVEEPFSNSNAARSLYDDHVLSLIQKAFHLTDRTLRLQKPLDSLWTRPTSTET